MHEQASEQRSSVSSAARAVDAASSARCLRPPRQRARHRGAYERALYAPGVFLKSGLLRAKEREWVKLLDSKKEREREKKKISLLHQLLLLLLFLSLSLRGSNSSYIQTSVRKQCSRLVWSKIKNYTKKHFLRSKC